MLNQKREDSRKQIGFYCMEDLVPKDHLLRKIEKAIDFSFIYDLVKDRYSEDTGRPSIDPVVLFKIVFIQYLFGIRSMRQTIKEIEVNAAYRWFLGYDWNDPIPHFTTFGKNYSRRFEGTDIFEKIFARILLVCDGAYLMIDPHVPQSLVFLRNVEKRSRKYEAGLIIISHSVVDFLAPEIKMYGQALLDIPCMKLLMGTDGNNLEETKELYHLTDAELELLESKKRGHALFVIGSKHLHINFEIPAYKFAYMGKAGSR